MTNNEHAEFGYRTLLVHAQKVGIELSAHNMEGVIVDLLTSLMHLSTEYSYNLEDLMRMATERFEFEVKCPQCGGMAVKAKKAAASNTYKLDDGSMTENTCLEGRYVCKFCDSHEVGYNQGVNDAYCSTCGEWQNEQHAS